MPAVEPRPICNTQAVRSAYDAVLVVSFGGPEKRADVIPFLENVLRGKPVPRERLTAVAEHYYHFGGRSPINDRNRELIAALSAELAARGPDLPIYWGNRNWRPFLADTVRKMRGDGVRRALAFATSAFSSYSGCRQYREDVARAQEIAGAGAPLVDKIRPFFNHPGFIEAMTDRVKEALSAFPAAERQTVKLLCTAHSIPSAMAAGCDYAAQLQESSRLIAEGARAGGWEVVYQSRSGPPSQPWLEPDVNDRLRELRRQGCRAVCIAPVGFLCDHMEVLYDLDVEAAETASSLDMKMVRAGAAGAHPAFIAGVRDLIAERAGGGPQRAAVGRLPPCPDVCPADCCPAPRRPAAPGAAPPSAARP